MGSSIQATLALAQASVSCGLIGREASEISVSSRQNFWNPPPVPVVPTVTLVPGLAFWNSSATASVTGATVLEPSAVITEDGAAAPPAGEEPLPPHAESAAQSGRTARSLRPVRTVDCI